MYADDIVLFAENENDLQVMLNQVNDWCSRWRMNVNVTKSNVVHFRKKRTKKTNCVFRMGNKEMLVVEQYKYLGIILNEFLDFSVTADALAKSGSRGLGAITNKFKVLKDMGYKTYTQLWNSCVVPILDYAAGVWGSIKQNKSEKVQQRAIKFFLGVHKCTANAAVVGDMGWKTCIHRYGLEMIRVWNRFMKMSNNRINKKVFLWDMSLEVNNWASEIESIYNDLNMSYIFENQIVCDLQNADKRLFELCNTEWKVEVNDKPKLRTYVTFKNNIGVEEYVTSNISRKNRSMMAQLRCGTLKLKIEVGRYHRIPVEQRLCEMCNCNQVEDEKHFLFRCELYKDIRNSWYEKIERENSEFKNLDVNEKLKYVMNFNQKSTSNFICEAYEIRKNQLYR